MIIGWRSIGSQPTKESAKEDRYTARSVASDADIFGTPSNIRFAGFRSQLVCARSRLTDNKLIMITRQNNFIGHLHLHKWADRKRDQKTRRKFFNVAEPPSLMRRRKDLDSSFFKHLRT